VDSTSLQDNLAELLNGCDLCAEYKELSGFRALATYFGIACIGCGGEKNIFENV